MNILFASAKQCFSRCLSHCFLFSLRKYLSVFDTAHYLPGFREYENDVVFELNSFYKLSFFPTAYNILVSSLTYEIYFLHPTIKWPYVAMWHYSHQAFISKRQDYMPCYYGNAYTKVHWEWEILSSLEKLAFSICHLSTLQDPIPCKSLALLFVK